MKEKKKKKEKKSGESTKSKSENSKSVPDNESGTAVKEMGFSPVFSQSGILRPVEGGRYSSRFGYRINPISGEYALHTGLDIAVPEGSRIRAALNGTVRKTGEDSHSGKYIFLTHSDGTETFYCHCSEILAQPGAVIRRGETIALVGSTGWATGPHVHFEIRKNGESIDPLPYLEGNDI